MLKTGCTGIGLLFSFLGNKKVEVLRICLFAGTNEVEFLTVWAVEKRAGIKKIITKPQILFQYSTSLI
jgi:hypothetical protein